MNEKMRDEFIALIDSWSPEELQEKLQKFGIECERIEDEHADLAERPATGAAV